MVLNHWSLTQAVRRNGVANARLAETRSWFFATQLPQMELDVNTVGKKDEVKLSEFRILQQLQS
jgi:hypothetical protein